MNNENEFTAFLIMVLVCALGGLFGMLAARDFGYHISFLGFFFAFLGARFLSVLVRSN